MPLTLQVGASHERLQGAVEDYEGRVQSLAQDLEMTKSNYHDACREIAELQEKVEAQESDQQKHQLLLLEVSGCD